MAADGDIDRVFVGLKTKLRNFRKEFGSEFLERVRARTPVVTGNLQKGWGYTLTAEDIRLWNVEDYAGFVEYGTPHIEPRGMLRTTLNEAEDIAKIAAERAKK